MFAKSDNESEVVVVSTTGGAIPYDLREDDAVLLDRDDAGSPKRLQGHAHGNDFQDPELEFVVTPESAVESHVVFVTTPMDSADDDHAKEFEIVPMTVTPDVPNEGRDNTIFESVHKRIYDAAFTDVALIEPRDRFDQI